MVGWTSPVPRIVGRAVPKTFCFGMSTVDYTGTSFPRHPMWVQVSSGAGFARRMTPHILAALVTSFASHDAVAVDEFCALAGRPLPSRLRYSPRRSASRSAGHTSELQSLMRISYAVFCLNKKKTKTRTNHTYTIHQNQHKN